VDSQPDPDIQIAGYRIEARVGRGGMGEVYRAVQLNLGRRVALKVLAPELADDDVFRRRFLRESRIAASIDHPSIIPIYETGEDGGLLYIAMRYVDGLDLATVLEREGRLEPARAMAIMAQVASALDAAHARGLVHRDVKPANILLADGPPGPDGHCYLCDFGLIKQVGTEQAMSALTATDQFVGTIPYVAPEQIEGGDLDGRTDVYSLGCVLYQCLTGSVPFEGANDVEVVFAHLREPPPPLSTRAPDLPPSIDPVVARAMAKAKEDRWPTCSSLVAALTTQIQTMSAAPPADDATRSMVLPPAPVPSSTPNSLPIDRVEPVASNPAQATDPAAAGPRFPLPLGPGSPAAPGTESPPAPAPPLARPAGTPVSARSASGPPVGERTELGKDGPATVHRGGPGDRGGAPAAVGWGGRGDGDRWGGPGGGRGRRRGRRWLTALAAVVLPVVAYLAAVEVFSGTEQPEVGAAPDQAGVAGGPPTTARAPSRVATCPGGFTQPTVGTATRTAPLAAIRAHMGWSDRFVVEEMRTWRGSDGQPRWYVKAHQESDPSRRGRWLVGEQEDGQRLVLASAPFETRGYAARDWRVVDGQAVPTEVAGCLAGT
jgi:serine/threonine protein kinase